MRSALLALAALGCYRSEAPPAAPIAKGQPRVARPVSDPLAFLPHDAQVVAFLDAVQLRRSPVWTRFEPTLLAKASTAMAHFQAACGFDVAPLITSVAAAVRGVDTPERAGVVVVRGVPRARLARCIDKVIANEKDVAYAFADARTLVLVTGHGASADTARRALDAGVPLRGSVTFMAMQGRVDTSRAAWFFLDGTANLGGLSTLGLTASAFAGAIDVTNGLEAKVIARMANPSEAQTLVTTLQPQTTALASLVSKLELATEDADVVIDLALTVDQLNMIAGLLGP